MGELTRKVQLSEGAKPGIPIMEISRIDRDTAEMIILVSTWSFATIFTKRNINKYIHATSLDPPFRNIRQSYIFTLLALKLSTKKSIWFGRKPLTYILIKVSTSTPLVVERRVVDVGWVPNSKNKKIDVFFQMKSIFIW